VDVLYCKALGETKVCEGIPFTVNKVLDLVEDILWLYVEEVILDNDDWDDDSKVSPEFDYDELKVILDANIVWRIRESDNDPDEEPEYYNFSTFMKRLKRCESQGLDADLSDKVANIIEKYEKELDVGIQKIYFVYNNEKVLVYDKEKRKRILEKRKVVEEVKVMESKLRRLEYLTNLGVCGRTLNELKTELFRNVCCDFCKCRMNQIDFEVVNDCLGCVRCAVRNCEHHRRAKIYREVKKICLKKLDKEFDKVRDKLVKIKEFVDMVWKVQKKVYNEGVKVILKIRGIEVICSKCGYLKIRQNDKEISLIVECWSGQCVEIPEDFEVVYDLVRRVYDELGDASVKVEVVKE